LENELEKAKEKIESLEKENVILKNSKVEIIQTNHEFEKVLEGFKDFEKCESEKYKSFESKMIEFESKIKELENENLALKRIESEKRKNSISRCSKLLNENNLLQSKVNELELIIQKFSTGEKSFNMLLGNQLFANNRKELGFDRETSHTTNQFVRQRRFIPKCVNCGEIGHSDINCLHKNRHRTVKHFENQIIQY